MVSGVGGSGLAKAARGDPELRVCSLAGFKLGCGVSLPSCAKMAYRVYGDIKASKLAIAGTSFGVTHQQLEYHYGKTIPAEYAFVVFNLMGNGVSYSPSTHDASEGEYPLFGEFSATVGDNVRAQKLALESDADLKGRSIDLVFGFSMGAMQAFEWARAYPSDVKYCVPLCGSSGCEDINVVFLEGLMALLESSCTVPEKLRAFALVYAGWYVGPTDFYGTQHWKTQGFKSLDDFLTNYSAARYEAADPDDLHAMVRTWRYTEPFSPEACKAIATKTLILPCDNDTYFRLENIQGRELQHMPNAYMKIVKSPWGHLAGNPQNLPEEFKFIIDAIADLLKE